MIMCVTCYTVLPCTWVQDASEELAANLYRLQVTSLVDMETGDPFEASASTYKFMQCHHGDATVRVTTRMTNRSLLTEHCT